MALVSRRTSRICTGKGYVDVLICTVVFRFFLYIWHRRGDELTVIHPSSVLMNGSVV